MAPARIDVRSESRTYSVLVGAGVLRQLPRLAASFDPPGRVLVVSCRPVWRRHGRRLARLGPPALMPDGERAKTLATAAALYSACVKARLDRAATLVAFGGGVVGDVAGFVAATYLRGIRLVQVPTTLLAQVDSAIGGKVGVNLPEGKNLVGAFHAPALVVCDPDVLTTLPRREFRAGLYEVVKYGVIASRDLFDRVSNRLDDIVALDRRVLAGVIAECCRIKADVVQRDERESGPRRALNFGHTLGHALEAVTRYRRFRHGEAIGWGMLAAARISAARGLMTGNDESRLRDLIERLGRRPSVSDLRIGDALDVIWRDKKVVSGRLHFVLASGIGAIEIATDVSRQELAKGLRAIGLRG
jgi:3-dehydroquinate synthase